MNREEDNPLQIPAPPPDPEAMDAAWNAAAAEFHRSRAARAKASPIRWIGPVAAAAAVAILCAVPFLRRPHPVDSSLGKKPPALEQIFAQGRRLFGDRLQAVTISKNRVVWHLSEDPDPVPASDQFVTLALRGEDTPVLYIAASPGTPVTIPYDGAPREIEFLPDASDQIIAMGDGIYWDSESPDSPIDRARLRNLVP